LNNIIFNVNLGLSWKVPYLFSSNQLSTLVLVSTGSPKLDGLDEVTQNLFSSLQSKLLINFLFFLSLYSWMIPKFLKAAP